MGKVVFILALFTILVFQISAQTESSHNFTEKLTVENLRDRTKALFAFDFNFEFDMDFEQISQDVHVFSRSVLENIFISANAKNTRVETGCGSINKLYLEEPHIGSNYFFPQNGMKLMTSAEANFDVLLQNLAEIFKLTKTGVKENHFQVKNSLKREQSSQDSLFADDYWFAQDPTDFICVNNIEKIKKYFPCGGKSGLISMIDQTKLFSADYISIFSEMNHKKEQKKVQISIKINAVINKKEFLNQFELKNLKKCPIYSNSELIIDSTEQRPYSKKIDLKQKFKEASKSFDAIMKDPMERTHETGFKGEISSVRHMGDKWVDFKGNLVHEITNNLKDSSVILQTSEFLIWQYQPVLHDIRLYRNDVLQDSKALNYTLKIEEDKSYLFHFFLELKPEERIRIIIPMNKLMKSFENYPHDPQRGHDLISGSILYYRQENPQEIKQLSSENLILRLPEPDFSMPFNIITYVCVLLGYVFLTFFLNSTSKPQ